jgi:hypothetical protein
VTSRGIDPFEHDAARIERELAHQGDVGVLHLWGADAPFRNPRLFEEHRLVTDRAENPR